MQFQFPRDVLPFEFDMERIIDDVIFVLFFCGNDFLPHLPSLDIRDGAIDTLFDLYKKLLPSLGGYVTDRGKVDVLRVERLLGEVGGWWWW